MMTFGKLRILIPICSVDWILLLRQYNFQSNNRKTLLPFRHLWRNGHQTETWQNQYVDIINSSRRSRYKIGGINILHIRPADCLTRFRYNVKDNKEKCVLDSWHNSNDIFLAIINFIFFCTWYSIFSSHITVINKFHVWFH